MTTQAAVRLPEIRWQTSTPKWVAAPQRAALGIQAVFHLDDIPQ